MELEIKDGAPSEDRVTQLLEKVVERRETRLTDEFEEKLKKLAAPRADRRLSVTAEEDEALAELDPKVDGRADRRPQGQVTTRVATHPLYARLDAEQAKWRSPESDHRVQQWLMALAANDVAAVHRVQDDIDDLYGRATWLVGDPATGIPDGTAGPMVPVPLLNLVEINRNRMAKIPGMSTAIQLTAMGHRIPRMNQATVGMVAEGSQQAAAEPVLDEKMMTSRKMQGHAIISLETLADSAFNTVGLLSIRMGQAMGTLEDVQATQSLGTGAEITEAIWAGLTYTDLVAAALTFPAVAAVYFGVGQPYRPNGVWFVDAFAAQTLTTIVDSGGYPIFSTQAGVPGAIVDDSADGFIFRRPVFEVPLQPNTGSGVIQFMDPTTYGWGRREGMTARTSDSVSWAADAVNFKFTQRIDGLMLDEGAVGNASRAGVENFT